MITFNKKRSLPIKSLKLYEKELIREQVKLVYTLKRKYKNILDRFSDVEGLGGGNLLYFLTLIPRIDSFKSTRSFLIYLGLRAVYNGRMNFNHRARQVLIRIAMKVAKYNGVRFNPRKLNWRYLRQLAILIYVRLRN